MIGSNKWLSHGVYQNTVSNGICFEEKKQIQIFIDKYLRVIYLSNY